METADSVLIKNESGESANSVLQLQPAGDAMLYFFSFLLQHLRLSQNDSEEEMSLSEDRGDGQLVVQNICLLFCSQLGGVYTEMQSLQFVRVHFYFCDLSLQDPKAYIKLSNGRLEVLSCYQHFDRSLNIMKGAG